MMTTLINQIPKNIGYGHTKHLIVSNGEQLLNTLTMTLETLVMIFVRHLPVPQTRGNFYTQNKNFKDN